MTRQKQLGFKMLENKIAKTFGGALHKNSNPKTARPVSMKRPMHLVVRSSHARGALSLVAKARKVADIVIDQGQRHRVRIYSYSNAGNHLHLIIRPESRRALHAFLRSICGLIARTILGCERGCAKNIKFWDARPFTRIVEWGRDFQVTSRYVMQNTLEAIGFVEYMPRRARRSG